MSLLNEKYKDKQINQKTYGSEILNCYIAITDVEAKEIVMGLQQGIKTLEKEDIDRLTDINGLKNYTNDEIKELFIAKENGNLKARDKIVAHNIRLVLSEVCRCYYKTEYELEDLCALGLRALVNATDAFKYTGEAVFATYLKKCVHNEINKYIKSQKNKIKPTKSLYDVVKIKQQSTGKLIEKSIIDSIYDEECDIEEIIEHQEINRIVRETVEELPERERECVKLVFGFYDRVYTCKEIGESRGIKGATISKYVNRGLEMIEKKLIEHQVIEPINIKNKSKRKKLQTIYEDFNEYTKEEIDFVLSQLPEDDMPFIIGRYGSDFNERSISTLNYDQSLRFYAHTRPKIKRRLLSLRNKKIN